MRCKRRLSLLQGIGMGLSVILVILSGCGRNGELGNTDGSNGIGPNGNAGIGDGITASGEAAMGRYMEEETDLSDLLSRPADMRQLEDGSIVIQDYNEGQLVSKDNGRTWESVTQLWLEEILPMRMTLGRDGTVGGVYTIESGGGNDTTSEAGGGMGCFIVKADGTRIDFPIEESEWIRDLRFSDNGDLYYQDIDGFIYRCRQEGDNWEVEKFMDIGEDATHFNISGNRLIVPELGKITVYDLETGSMVEDEALSEFAADKITAADFRVDSNAASMLVLPFIAEPDVMYLPFAKGLFRHVMGGSLVEQVIDGNLSKFGDPSTAAVSVVLLENNEFLALYTNGTLVRYVYNPDITAVPAKLLRAYSLEENRLLRQAITNYRSQNPDVYVQYEIGMDAGSAVTREDALKNLNMDILAGKGPDLLVLDNMPIGSYMEKGVLADLTPYLEDIGAILPVMQKTYQREGEILALPAEFSVPLIAGDRELVDNIPDLKGFADALEAWHKANADVDAMGYMTAEKALAVFSLGSAHTWQRADGSVDEAAIGDFLAQAKRIYDLENSDQGKELYNEADVYSNIYSMDTLSFWAGDSIASFGLINNSFDMAITASVMKNAADREMMLKVMPGSGGGVYHPASIIGLNAGSPNQEMAGALLKELFNKNTLYSTHGYPTKMESFNEQFTNTSAPDDDMGSMTMPKEDGSIRALDIKWPEEAWVNDFRSTIENAAVPDLTDSVLREMVLEEGLKVLDGSKTVEETVMEIMGRAAIYMAE